MNAGRGSFAYSQTRLQARLGQMPDTGELQRARAGGDLASFLAAVRTTSQRHYAARLAPAMDPHDIERHLRQEWSALVEEVTRWQPAPWQSALRWLRWLPYLPALQKLARGGRPPAWTRADPVLGRIVATDPTLRGAALAGTPLQPLRPALDAAGDITATWLDHWRTLWPDRQGATRDLESIVQHVAMLDAALRQAPPGRDSRELQRDLARRLLRTFRRNPLSPAAAAAYLGLEALGLLDLRGGVMRRAVVVPGPA